jgi:alpha-N-acetylglucosamine transferase
MKKNYGFILFFTQNFEEISNNLIDTVLEFSKYNIEVISINYDYIPKNNRIISTKIILKNVNFESIMSIKLIASINTKFDIALILDSDMIVTKNIDNIFDENEYKVNNTNVPLFAKHPHKYNTFETCKQYINMITNKNPKMPWVFANYIFTQNHKWFFTKAYELYLKYPFIVDEIIINALLVEYEVDYDLGYNYFPNCTDDIVKYYLSNFDDKYKESIISVYNDIPVKFYAFHGHLCKNKEYTANLIKQIKNI